MPSSPASDLHIYIAYDTLVCLLLTGVHAYLLYTALGFILTFLDKLSCCCDKYPGKKQHRRGRVYLPYSSKL